MPSAQTKRLQDRLAAIQKSVNAAVRPALIEAGQELVDRMQSLAPVDTGKLRDSIVMTPPGQSTPAHSQPGGSRTAGPDEVLITAGNEKVRYAHFVEFGTSHSHAEPFFWPAVREMQSRLKQRVSEAVSKAVKDSG